MPRGRNYRRPMAAPKIRAKRGPARQASHSGVRCRVDQCASEGTRFMRMAWACERHYESAPLDPNCAHRFSVQPPGQDRICSFCCGVLEVADGRAPV